MSRLRALAAASGAALLIAAITVNTVAASPPKHNAGLTAGQTEAPVSQAQQTTPMNWAPVGEALGIPGTEQAGGVYRIDIPRTDLNVHVIGEAQSSGESHGDRGRSHRDPRHFHPDFPRLRHDHGRPDHSHGPLHYSSSWFHDEEGSGLTGLQSFRVKPAFALGGYLTFMSTGFGDEAMMMGDLVLTESEIEPVMLSLEQNGIEIAAIHNHILWEKPTVMYMHVMVTGDAVQLATAVHNALALTNTPLTPAPPAPNEPPLELNTTALDQIMGLTGKASGGVYKYSIAPTYEVTSMGMTIPPAMGMSTSLAFQPLGHGQAAITGDFSLLANQVNPVLDALRNNGIYVTALHSHMLEATPTVFFMHFLATGNELTLAHGLRAALDAVTSNPPA